MTDTRTDGANPYTPSDVSGKRAQSRSRCGLEDVLAAADELLLMPDRGGIVTALGGTITATSPVASGRGTRITVRLPVPQAASGE